MRITLLRLWLKRAICHLLAYSLRVLRPHPRVPLMSLSSHSSFDTNVPNVSLPMRCDFVTSLSTGMHSTCSHCTVVMGAIPAGAAMDCAGYAMNARGFTAIYRTGASELCCQEIVAHYRIRNNVSSPLQNSGQNKHRRQYRRCKIPFCLWNRCD